MSTKPREQAQNKSRVRQCYLPGHSNKFSIAVYEYQYITWVIYLHKGIMNCPNCSQNVV